MISTVGGPGRFTLKKSWNEKHYINNTAEKILRNNNHLTIHKCPICRNDAYEWFPYTKKVVESLNGRTIYQSGF